MIAKRSISRPPSAKASSLGLKLLGLFAVAFALAFALFFAYDLFSSFAERSIVNAQGDQTQPIVVDPKLEADLAKVLAFDSAPEPQAVKDPFTDRGGLSGTVAAAIASGAQPGTIVTSGTVQNGSTTVASSGRINTNGSTAPLTPAAESTQHRYEAWLGRANINSDLPIDPRIFAIADLLPVGIVDGGSGQQEVMFYSEGAGKTFSFPVGTLFYDGWLTEVRPEGVVFSFNDDRRTVRMRAWARSIQDNGQTKTN